MKSIDMEKLETELQKAVEDRGYTTEIPDFADITVDVLEGEECSFDKAEFAENLYYMNCNYDVPYYAIIPKTGLKNFLKRLIRKLVKPVVFPLSQQQNLFNGYVTRTMNMINAYINENGQTGTGVKSGEEQKQHEKEFFDHQEKMVEKLETKVLLLEQRIEELEKELRDGQK